VSFRTFSLSVLALSALSLGCRSQVPSANMTAAAGQPLSPALARRVEVLLRQKAALPPGSSVNVGTPTVAELPGYVNVPITVSTEGKTSRPISFLLSNDGKTLAQFNKFDISADPRTLISADGRPARGGPASAPVLIVGFDDLQCPYCARLHSSIFPAITARYGDKVHFVYKDYPLTEIHPWAMRAAVDVNCLGEQSSTGYWNAVDYIHAHAGEFGRPDADAANKAPSTPAAADTAPERTVARANEQLDKAVREQAKSQKVDTAKLDACLAKQDTAAIEASRQVGTRFGVDSTPSLFINGDKIDGAVPLPFIFNVIDNALRAEGVTPPPPYVEPAAPAATAKPAAPTS
jgi:protein-disulfide isomerase